MVRAAGRVVDATGGDVLESVDPATGEVLGTVSLTRPEAVGSVAAGAAAVQRGWSLVPLEHRLAVIGRAAEDVLDRRDGLSRFITRESGKTVTESMMMEVGPTALRLSWLAKWTRRYLSPERIPDPQPFVKQKRHWVLFRPLGVVGVITPWNYPFTIPAAQVAMALAAGNGVLLKPSEYTPLVAEEIAAIFDRAGLPKGLLRVVHGSGDVGAAVCAAEPVEKVFFTGSVATGRAVLAEAGRNGKSVQLELGGKDPAIVCADADLRRAVAGTLWAGASNAGQTCAGIERVYVDRRVHGKFVRLLVEAASSVRPGDPSDPSTQLGPMTNEPQYRKVLKHLDDAVAKGARVECGGPTEVAGLSGRFVAPTVLTGVDHSMRVMTEETFGPLIPVMPFDSEREAVRLSNDSIYGLGASVWTRDRARARMIAERLDAGMVWVNDHMYSHGLPQLPWGGTKSSGLGVTHSRFGLYDMVEKRLVAEDAGRLPVGWWYPYDDVKRRGFAAVVESMARSRASDRARALWRSRSDLARYVRGLLR